MNGRHARAAALIGAACVAAAVVVSVGVLARCEEIGRLSLVMFLVPAIGVALAAAVFGERFGTSELVGLAAVAAAAVIASVSRGGLTLPATAVQDRSN